jgi:fibronectin-binding autotransporter adhesin
LPFIYGNWITGTGVSFSGAGPITFAGRGSQQITSASRTFTFTPTIDSPSGSVTLQDALNTSRSIGLNSGTFNTNNYNVTDGLGFSSVNSNTRTLALGSGTWTSAGAGASAWTTSTSTNLTVTGTGTISLTSASAKTFNGGGASFSGITLNQGGAGTLTITGNNTFANISNSAGVATTILMSATTQTVGEFTASGTVGNVLTVQGTSATSPCTLIYTGVGLATPVTTDYLTLTGVRAYPLTNTWYAGTNSTNNGSLGWTFNAAVVLATASFFLLF